MNDQNVLNLLSFSTFAKLAIDLLDVCYQTNEADAETLITSELISLPQMTCIDLAIATKQKDFVAHSAIQGILNDAWTGAITSRHIQAREVIAIICFPFLLLNVEIRTQEEMESMIQADGYDATSDGENNNDRTDGSDKVKRAKTK